MQDVKFPIFSYFLKNSYFFLFFTKIPIFQQFFSTFILFFSQKLKEASKIRRISYSGKSLSVRDSKFVVFPTKMIT